METSAQIVARLWESDPDRVHDPEAIEAKLASLTPAQRETFWKVYRTGQSRLTSLELAQRKKLIGLFKDTADDIQSDILRVIQSLPGGDGETWDLRSMRRVARDQHLIRQINNRIGALGGSIEESVEMDVVGSYKASWYENAWRLDQLTPASTNISFGILPDREILALMDEPFKGANFSERLGVITDEMADTIKTELMRSMIAEESWSQAARRIRDEMGTVGRGALWRADMIARTELARAQETAARHLFEENSDVIADLFWLAHPGACPEICAPKHGKSVSVVGYPIEDSHPSCVCDTVAKPMGWDDLAQDGDENTKPNPITFSAWKKEKGIEGAE